MKDTPEDRARRCTHCFCMDETHHCCYCGVAYWKYKEMKKELETSGDSIERLTASLHRFSEDTERAVQK